MAVKKKPDRYHTITPYLVVQGAAKAMDFYKKAFGAKETMRLPGPEGTLMHAEFKIGDSHVMLADENIQWHALSPTHLGGTCVALLIYVDNCDKVVDKAVAAGAKLERPVQDQFYGDRSGMVIDPFGHRWTIATHIEDVSPKEIMKRYESMR